MSDKINKLKFNPDKSLQDWFSVLISNGFRLVIGFAASVLIARTLGPGNFGTYAILAGVIAVCTTFSDFGLSNAAVKYISHSLVSQSTRVKQFATVYCFSKMALASIFMLLGIFLSAKLATWLLDNRELSFLMALCFLGLFTTALSNCMTTLLQAAQRFHVYSLIQLINPIIMLIVVFVLAWFDFLTVHTLLWLIIGIPVIVAIYSFTKVRFLFLSNPNESLRRSEFRSKTLKELFGFSKWIFIAAIGASLFSQIDIFLAQKLVGSEATGRYALGLSLAMKAAMLNGTLVTIYLPSVSQLKSVQDFKSFLRSTLLKTIPASVLILATFPFIDNMILLFYGDAFQSTASIARVLLIMIIVNLNVLPFSLLAYPLNRPYFLALGEIGKVVLFLLFVWPFANRYGVLGLALSKLVAEVLIGIFYFILFFRLRKMQFNNFRNYSASKSLRLKE